MAPPSREGAIFFQKYTSFSSKSKPKTQKNRNTSLEQGLLGTAQMKLLTGGFEAEPLFAHWIQAVAPLMANLTQAVSPLLAKGTCAVPYINPKHQGERHIKS